MNIYSNINKLFSKGQSLLRNLFQIITGLFADTFIEWRKQKPHLIGAALAFYILFSLGPILVLSVWFTDTLLGSYVTESQVFSEIRIAVGDQPASALDEIIKRANRTPAANVTPLISIPILFLAATLIFYQLVNALDHIWEVPYKKRTGFRGIITDYLFAFSMLVIVGFLLLALILKSMSLSILSEYLPHYVPYHGTLIHILDSTVSFAIVTGLFAFIYKILPETPIHWSDVWIGAAVTAFLFTASQFFIGFYIRTTHIATGYGALGSFTIVIVWVFYSSLVFLFGAAFTKVYSKRFGSFPH